MRTPAKRPQQLGRTVGTASQPLHIFIRHARPAQQETRKGPQIEPKIVVTARFRLLPHGRRLLELAAENLSMDPKALHIAARSENMCAVTADKVEKKLFGLMKKTSHPLRLIDEEGVIRLQKANATVRQADISSWRDAVAYMLEELTVYNDGGTNYPNVYIVLGKRIIDLSGMSSEEQIYSLANVELNGYDAKTPVIVAATLRIDS